MYIYNFPHEFLLRIHSVLSHLELWHAVINSYSTRSSECRFRNENWRGRRAIWVVVINYITDYASPESPHIQLLMYFVKSTLHQQLFPNLGLQVNHTMLRSCLQTNVFGPRPLRALARSIHVDGSQVPKTEANTGKGTNNVPKETHNTGPKGDGDMPHPKEYVDGIEPVNGDEQSPEKKPTRSTGIKSGKGVCYCPSLDTNTTLEHDG